MLATDADPASLAGLEVVDRRGERIGRVRQVYADGEHLGWVGVRGNLLGTEEALVPLDGAELEDDVIGVPVSRDRFSTAPRRRPDARLEPEEADVLRRYWSALQPEPTAPADAEPQAEDETGAATELTAYEERLVATTERVPRTRVRLRKVIVTEERTLTVPVRREEYRLVREPIVDGEAVPGGAIGADEQEVVLHEERIVLSTEVVPIERVRLMAEDVVVERTVTGTIRGERIEVVDDEPADPPAVEAPEPAADPTPSIDPAAPATAAPAPESEADPELRFVEPSESNGPPPAVRKRPPARRA